MSLQPNRKRSDLKKNNINYHSREILNQGFTVIKDVISVKQCLFYTSTTLLNENHSQFENGRRVQCNLFIKNFKLEG